LNDADERELDVGDHRVEFRATFPCGGHNATRNRFTAKLSSRRLGRRERTVKFCPHN
jgi:hypothetical protein